MRLQLKRPRAPANAAQDPVRPRATRRTRGADNGVPRRFWDIEWPFRVESRRMTQTSFSCFLHESPTVTHEGLAAALDNIRSYRGNESTADHEIGILRIGDTFDTGMLTAYLDWLATQLGATDLPKALKGKQVKLFEQLQSGDYSMTPQARLRLERTLALLK